MGYGENRRTRGQAVTVREDVFGPAKANAGQWGTTDVGGITEGTYKDDLANGGKETVITKDGAINPAVIDHNSTANLTAGDVHTHYARVVGRAGENLVVQGNLIVEGQRVRADSEIVVAAVNHVYMNSGYTTAVAQTGGLVVNYLPTATADTVADAFVAGVAATSNPTVTTTGSDTFAEHDFIQISNSTSNDGLFEVEDHTGTTLTVRGVGTVAAVEDFTLNQFTAEAGAGAITKVAVSVMRAGADGVWETAAGSATTLSFDNVVGEGATQTLTDKTLTAPDINGGTVDSLTALSIRSTGAAFDLTLATATVFTAGRTLTVDPGDAARTVTLSGNPTLDDWFDQSVKAASSPTFVNLTITSFAANWTNAGRTVADLGIITTADINGGTVDSLTALSVRSTGAAFDLTLATATVFTAGRTLTIDPGDAARTITLSGNPTLSDWFDQDVKTTANPTFANLTITSFAADWTNAGRTVADLGVVTTVDINGGTIDGVTIATSSLTTPTIGDFTNATHTHQNAAGGGTLDAAAIAAGTLAVARGGTGVTSSTGTTNVVLSGSPTIVTPDINGGTVDSLTALSVRSSGAAFDLTLATATVLTAGRTLTIDPGDAARTVTLSGNPTLADWFDQDVKSAANPTFGNLSITSFAANWTNAGRTVADLGVVTTVDINGGTIDGVTIGGASAGAITGTTITADDMAFSSGAVLSFNAGDVTVTHSANTLAMEGGSLVVGTSAVVSDEIALFYGSSNGIESVFVKNASDSALSRTQITLLRADNNGFQVGVTAAAFTPTTTLVAKEAYLRNSDGSMVLLLDTDDPIRFSTNTTADGANSERAQINTTAFQPGANGRIALGIPGTGFSDAAFASGAVIDFGNTNYTATHSAGLLTLSGDLSLANLTITSFAANWTNAGRTIADLGIVTTVDINGGTIDGAVIGGAAAAAVTGTTIDATTDFTVGATVITDGVLTDAGGFQIDANVTLNGNLTTTAGDDVDMSAGGRLFGAGVQLNHQTLVADTNLVLDENDASVGVTLGNGSDNTITLPAASGNEGMVIHVFVVDGSGANDAVVTRAGGDTITNGSGDVGNTTVTLGDTADFVLLVCVSSSAWNIVHESGTAVA